MSSQEEETSYQNQLVQEKFDLQDPSQGINYDEAELLTASIVPEEVETTEIDHTAQVTTIIFNSTISKPVSIIDRKYFFTKGQRKNNVKKVETGPE